MARSHFRQVTTSTGVRWAPYRVSDSPTHLRKRSGGGLRQKSSAERRAASLKSRTADDPVEPSRKRKRDLDDDETNFHDQVPGEWPLVPGLERHFTPTELSTGETCSPATARRVGAYLNAEEAERTAFTDRVCNLTWEFVGSPALQVACAAGAAARWTRRVVNRAGVVFRIVIRFTKQKANSAKRQCLEAVSFLRNHREWLPHRAIPERLHRHRHHHRHRQQHLQPHQAALAPGAAAQDTAALARNNSPSRQLLQELEDHVSRVRSNSPSRQLLRELEEHLERAQSSSRQDHQTNSQEEAGLLYSRGSEPETDDITSEEDDLFDWEDMALEGWASRSATNRTTPSTRAATASEGDDIHIRSGHEEISEIISRIRARKQAVRGIPSSQVSGKRRRTDSTNNSPHADSEILKSISKSQASKQRAASAQLGRNGTSVSKSVESPLQQEVNRASSFDLSTSFPRNSQRIPTSAITRHKSLGNMSASEHIPEEKIDMKEIEHTSGAVKAHESETKSSQGGVRSQDPMIAARERYLRHMASFDKPLGYQSESNTDDTVDTVNTTDPSELTEEPENTQTTAITTDKPKHVGQAPGALGSASRQEAASPDTAALHAFETAALAEDKAAASKSKSKPARKAKAKAAHKPAQEAPVREEPVRRRSTWARISQFGRSLLGTSRASEPAEQEHQAAGREHQLSGEEREPLKEVQDPARRGQELLETRGSSAEDSLQLTERMDIDSPMAQGTTIKQELSRDSASHIDEEENPIGNAEHSNAYHTSSDDDRDGSLARLHEDIRSMAIEPKSESEEVEDESRETHLSPSVRRSRRIQGQKDRKEAELKKKADERDAAKKRLRDSRATLDSLTSPSDQALPPLASKWSQKLISTMRNETDPNAELATSLTKTPLNRHAFGTCVPGTGDSASGWLNDEIILAYLEHVVDYAKGLTKDNPRPKQPRDEVPRYATFNSHFWSNIVAKGPASVSRWPNKLGLKGDRLLQAELVFIPINTGYHWTLLALYPRRRHAVYYDSMGNHESGTERRLRPYLASHLGKDYVAEEWTFEVADSPQQANSSDCGAFAITTARMLALGFDPKKAYGPADMQMQRRRILCELMNGGFHGDFKPRDAHAEALSEIEKATEDVRRITDELSNSG